MTLAPIALFAYNRLDHLRRTVTALQANDLAKESELLVFSDGPKNERDAGPVRDVRAYLATISGFKKISIIERPRNFGLAASIIAGVTELTATYGHVIVLEDDLVVSPHFLRYMNEGLQTYKDEPRIASIHGYVYPVKKPLPETFFIKGADCWGWATWKRAWDAFEPDGKKLLEELHSRDLGHEFNFNDTIAYRSMLKGQIAGKNDSWAVRWYASAFLQGMLTLYPGRSLVQNIGFDGSGTHSGKGRSFASDLSPTPVVIRPIPTKEDAEARKIFIEFFGSLKPSISKRFFAKIGRGFHALIRRSANWLYYAISMPFQEESVRRLHLTYQKYRDIYENMPALRNDHFMIPFWKSLIERTRELFLEDFGYSFLKESVIQETMFISNRPILQKEELAFLEKMYPQGELARLLREPVLGKPLIENLRYRTSHNSIHHLHHIAQFSDKMGVQPSTIHRVVEWGGGYGNMCRIWQRINPGITYVIIDLPEFSAIQATYLETLFGKDRVRFMREPGPIEPGIITIIPLDEQILNHIDFGTPDLFISTWALSESAEYAQQFLESHHYFDARHLLLAYQKKSDEIPHAESIINHLAGFQPAYHQEILQLKDNYYLFCHETAR